MITEKQTLRLEMVEHTICKKGIKVTHDNYREIMQILGAPVIHSAHVILGKNGKPDEVQYLCKKEKDRISQSHRLYMGDYLVYCFDAGNNEYYWSIQSEHDFHHTAINGESMDFKEAGEYIWSDKYDN